MADVPRAVSGRTAMEVAREVAVEAGRMLLRRFPEVKHISVKGRGNVVTDVDVEVEAAMFARLASEFPDVSLMGEESATGRADAGLVWIVDPLDGTRNYASGIPFFSLVLALARDGEVLLGINYDPVREEMFHAERAKGAFLNDEPIHVSERARIEESVLGMDLSYSGDGAVNGLNAILSLWPGMQTARIMGSSALGISYAAAGRHDLYFHHQLEPWDQAAGILLVEEAGGVITDRTGGRAGLYSDGLVASNVELHAEFMRKTEGTAWRLPTHRLV